MIILLLERRRPGTPLVMSFNGDDVLINHGTNVIVVVVVVVVVVLSPCMLHPRVILSMKGSFR